LLNKTNNYYIYIKSVKIRNLQFGIFYSMANISIVVTLTCQ